MRMKRGTGGVLDPQRMPGKGAASGCVRGLPELCVAPALVRMAAIGYNDAYYAYEVV